MSYVDLGAWLFLGWLASCILAYVLSFKTGRDTRMIPFLFGITIAVFYAGMHGRAPHFRHWWYVWNMIPPTARSRTPLMVISTGGLILDTVYYWFAAIGDRLPGSCYFCVAASIETLQIACMVYFSGPVEPVIRKLLTRAWTFISTRKWPWTHQQFQRV